MERTDEFSKIVRKKRKDENIKTPQEDILRPIKKPNLFIKAANTILKEVRETQQFLEEHSSGYVDAHKYLSSRDTLTEQEKDKIDDDVNNAITKCFNEIDRLKAHVAKQTKKSKGGNSQTMQHLNGIVMYLYQNLNSAHDHFSKQKALRFRNTVAELGTVYHRTPNLYTQVNMDDFETGEEEEDLGLNLSIEDRDRLEQKTQSLFRSLGDDLDVVRQIEKQVVAISSLQQQFSIKVLEQQEAIDHLQRITVESVVRVESGVEHLRSAQRSVSDYRLIVLATLLILSFTLLFLHWYT